MSVGAGRTGCRVRGRRWSESRRCWKGLEIREEPSRRHAMGASQGWAAPSGEFARSRQLNSPSIAEFALPLSRCVPGAKTGWGAFLTACCIR
jgi:hypothetical protein